MFQSPEGSTKMKLPTFSFLSQTSSAEQLLRTYSEQCIIRVYRVGPPFTMVNTVACEGADGFAAR